MRRNELAYALLRILFEDLFSFKGSLSPRFVRVKHDDRYCGTSGRSTRNGSGSEATRIRVHETTTVSPVDVGIAASYGTSQIPSPAVCRASLAGYEPVSLLPSEPERGFPKIHPAYLRRASEQHRRGGAGEMP